MREPEEKQNKTQDTAVRQQAADGDVTSSSAHKSVHN